jgi:hypothetical protein
MMAFRRRAGVFDGPPQPAARASQGSQQRPIKATVLSIFFPLPAFRVA